LGKRVPGAKSAEKVDRSTPTARASALWLWPLAAMASASLLRNSDARLRLSVI
jgi:hypothetical protein